MKLFSRMHKRVSNALAPDIISECNHEFHYAGTRSGGLFIDVNWDKENYPSKIGSQVKLGKSWMVNSLILIEN